MVIFSGEFREGADGKGDKVGVDEPTQKCCYQKISKDRERRKEAGESSQHRKMNTHLGFQISQRNTPVLYV